MTNDPLNQPGLTALLERVAPAPQHPLTTEEVAVLGTRRLHARRAATVVIGAVTATALLLGLVVVLRVGAPTQLATRAADSSSATTTSGPAGTAAPALAVTPAPPFTDGATVVVSGTGFPPDAPVAIGECPPNIDCGAWTVAARSDTAGQFRVPLRIQQTFSFPMNNGLTTTIETRSCSSGCTIIAHTVPPATQISAPPIPFTITNG